MTADGITQDVHAKLEEVLADSENLRRLTRSVVHDINNLLSVITGYTELMLRHLRPSDPLHRNVESIRKAAEWGGALVQQIVASLRKQPTATMSVDLNELVANITRVIQPLVGDRIDMVSHLEPRLPPVHVNPGQMGQVLMNLVINARDAMPQGGRLTVETRRAASEVVLRVSDTGSGIDARTRPRLFEPYFTTKSPGKGTGLGLATVYDVVTQNNGRIEVTSDADEGTTFAVFLPALAENEPLGASAGSGAVQVTTKTVLLVEDEGEVRGLIRDILKLYGYAVLEARDRGDALALCGRHEGTIDLVIASVSKPGPATDELIQDVLATRAGIKVLYLSGYLEDDEEAESAARFGPVLRKPFTVAAFVDAVRQVLVVPTGSAGA